MKMKWTVWLMIALMGGAAMAGILRPEIPERVNFLETTVPPAFGEWRQVQERAQIDPVIDDVLKKIYKEVVSRTYVNASGYRIMLSAARSGNQIGIQQAHLPEICYPAQGFDVTGNVDGELATAYGPIEVRRLTTHMRERHEPVTYWQTMADQVVKSQWDKRKVQLRAVWQRVPPDGILFRVSSIDREPEHAFAMQQKFVADLMTAVGPDERKKLSGLIAPTRTASAR